MSTEEMIKKKIWIPPTDFNTCPKCGYPMKHGFGINSYQCTNCEYNEESQNIKSFKSKKFGFVF